MAIYQAAHWPPPISQLFTYGQHLPACRVLPVQIQAVKVELLQEHHDGVDELLPEGRAVHHDAVFIAQGVVPSANGADRLRSRPLLAGELQIEFWQKCGLRSARQSKLTPSTKYVNRIPTFHMCVCVCVFFFFLVLSILTNVKEAVISIKSWYFPHILKLAWFWYFPMVLVGTWFGTGTPIFCNWHHYQVINSHQRAYLFVGIFIVALVYNQVDCQLLYVVLFAIAHFSE